MENAAGLTLLHLSDPQFGAHHRFGSTDPFDTLFARLVEDLDKLAGEYGLRPDLVVVSGDLAEWGRRSEFEQALDFLRRLSAHLRLGPERFAIIPGNHDVNRDLCNSYFAECKGDEREPKPPYWSLALFGHGDPALAAGLRAGAQGVGGGYWGDGVGRRSVRRSSGHSQCFPVAGFRSERFS